MLSTELWLHVLDILDCESLLRCMQTSHAMRDLIRGTASLRYKIALKKAHLKDGPINEPGDMASSSATRLELLADHQKAWKDLSWSQDMKIKMTRSGLWELFGGVFAQNTPDGGFVFHQLPSKLRLIPYETWSLDGCGFPVRDFGMDPAQDLLVLIECPDQPPAQGYQYKLHLVNIRNGKPHPAAPKVDLKPPPRSASEFQSPSPSSFSIQVAGDYIGVLAIRNDAPRELTIWNWKTGTTKLSNYGVQLKSFAFLSSEFVLIATVVGAGMDDGTLDVVNFQTVDTVDEICHYSDTQPTVRLQYPAYRDHTFLHDLDIRNDPGPLWREKGGVPFSVNPTESLYIVRMWIIVQGSVGCLLHLIPSPTLLSFVERGGTIPWIEWGPSNTMLGLPQTSPSSTWVCFVHGWKCVIGGRISTGKKGFVAHCCDFSPSAVMERKSRRSEESGEVEFEENGAWRDPEAIPFHELFRDPIGKYIPYRENEFHLPDSHAHCDVMCSEDSIIVVDSICREFRILSF